MSAAYSERKNGGDLPLLLRRGARQRRGVRLTCEAEGISRAQAQCQHVWSYSGTAYGGDDERYHGDGRCYCSLCGLDGDA